MIEKGKWKEEAKFLNMDPMHRRLRPSQTLLIFFFLLNANKIFKLERKFNLENVKINVKVSKLMVLPK